MAWTSSATQRRSFAPSTTLVLARIPTANILLYIGKGDRKRGACVTLAAFLTGIGMAAPNLSAECLSTILLVAGALSALIAITVSDAEPLRTYGNVKGAGPQSARSGQSVPLTRAAPRITELLERAPKAGADLAVWAKLTAHMSHELRTPLNAVLGFSELMSNETFGPLGSSNYQVYALDIHTSGRKLLKSTEDALAITALLTAPEPRGAGASSCVLTAAQAALAFHARALSDAGITVACSVPAGVDVVVEAQTLRQILINLVSEAIAVSGRSAHLSIALTGTGGEIVLAVTLNGHDPAKRASSDSFAVMLARTLVELCGASHFVVDDGETSSVWRASTLFARSSQTDFFQRAGLEA